MDEIVNKSKNSPSSNYNMSNMDSKDAAYIFKALIESTKEYEITREIETTKRLDIENRTKRYLEALKDHKELMEKSLTEQFNQRKETIDKMFDYIDQALNSDKDEIVVAALNNITEIVKTPVQGIAAIKQAFDSDYDLIL